jgi:hypothetical protein
MLLAAMAGIVAGQQQPVPQPFPRPGEPARPADPQPVPDLPPPPPTPLPPPTAAHDKEAPTEATLGLPIYPAAHFVGSFDAGRGQRFYLFGTTGSFTEIVGYYRGLLNTRGTLIFDAPAMHAFDVGRFREETMAFPPGVTVKDYTWNGSEGYLNPKLGAEPRYFRTIIQIVPLPPGSTYK